MSPKVLTIILNYKTAEMTLRSVESARRAMQDIAGEILVVDNDSQDGSFETIAAKIAENGWDKGGETGHTRVIQSGHNGGFGAGNNVGIRAGLSDGTKPDFYYVLNSDAFPTPGAIAALLAHLQANPKTGFAGSYIYGEDGTRHTTTFRFPSAASEFESAIRFGPVTRLLRSRRVPLEGVTTDRAVDWIAGASLMMRADVLDDIGLFDETFFLYFEETDLCRRARQAGYGIDYVHASEVMHIGSVSTGMGNWARVPGYWFDSRWHYFAKNHGAFYASLATMVHLLGGALHWVRCLITRKKRGVQPRFLTTLLTHDTTALFQSLFKSGSRGSRNSTPQPGE